MRKLTHAHWLLLLVTLPIGGCIVPFPHVKQTCGPIEGAVVDAATGEPVADADVHVEYPDGDRRDARTGPDGGFRFGSKYRFHYGFVFGVALNYSLPYDLGWHDFACITIRADGYEPAGLVARDIPIAQEMGESYLRDEGVKELKAAAQSDGDRSAMDGSAEWFYPKIPLTPLAPKLQSPVD